jgi:hypothetical protein
LKYNALVCKFRGDNNKRTVPPLLFDDNAIPIGHRLEFDNANRRIDKFLVEYGEESKKFPRMGFEGMYGGGGR